MAEPRTEQDVIARYKQLRQELGNLSQKINELEAEAQEHSLVLKTLEPLDADRKCFRLIGGVLVEQTVGAVKPVVDGNANNLRNALNQISTQLEAKQKETLAFQQKWKIRVQGEQEPEEEQKLQKQGQQGVLVSKS